MALVSYPPETEYSIGRKGYQEIRERIDSLRMQHNVFDRRRIRAVMNGGPDGVIAILGWGREGPAEELKDMGIDLPVANLMFSGLEKLAQKIGRVPTLKTDMLPIKDNDTARTRAEKRARIVSGWDEMGRMEMQYPQIGRWLPGYGFVLHVIRERKQAGHTYPFAELRDPFDCYPGFWGPDQQPTEVAIIRNVDEKWMRRQYPNMNQRAHGGGEKRRGWRIFGQSSWEGESGNIEIAEYIDEEGTYLVSLDTEELLLFIPNPLSSGPAFVMTKRFSFDRLGSQYAHVFGLMAMMAKLNILGLIGVEDSVFRETNIHGEMISEKYEKGRNAINFFEAGTQVNKPTGEVLNQLWQGVNIVERQFRIVAAYDVAQDGISPNSFATGAGIEQLQSSEQHNVREYQTAIKHSAELIDRKRLEWEDVMHPSASKRVYWYEGGNSFEEIYVPSVDIALDYRTRRVYGAMATFDETSKILAGLQLNGAKILDRRTVRENLDGDLNDQLIEERLLQDEALAGVMGALNMRAQNQDPAALNGLWQIYKSPKDFEQDIEEALQLGDFAPDPQLALGTGLPPEPGGGDGRQQMPSQTILSQIEAQGGGAQTVARN